MDLDAEDTDVCTPVSSDSSSEPVTDQSSTSEYPDQSTSEPEGEGDQEEGDDITDEHLMRVLQEHYGDEWRQQLHTLCESTQIYYAVN
jgi:hypothetical protein